MRVLVVDDNSTNLDLMLYLLRAFGHDATGCADGATGLETALRGDFDAVLVDILMPTMDGYEFARRFRAAPALRALPLIAVTALAMPSDRERIASAGFDGYIAKPLEPRTFVAQIEGFARPAGP